MKNLIKNTIISQAIELGFDFEQFTNDADLQEVSEALIDFFNENSDKLPRLEDECEVTSNGRTQHVSYGDFWSDGEIVDFSANWHKAPETKIFHSDFVMEDTDGLMKNMHLYYLVGENDYNAPDGYYYSKSEKRHVKEEEMRKIFHLEIKSEGSHMYYGSLSALCLENPNLGVSKFTLDRFDFTEPFENAICIIRKSVMKTTGSVGEKKD